MLRRDNRPIIEFYPRHTQIFLIPKLETRHTHTRMHTPTHTHAHTEALCFEA